MNYLSLERLLCPIFLGNEKPLKPTTIALKIGHLAFQEGTFRGAFFLKEFCHFPPQKKKQNLTNWNFL